MSTAMDVIRGRVYEQVYQYVRSYLLLKGISPTLEEIAQNFGVHRVTAHQHVKRLVGLGLIAKNGKSSRQLELTDPSLRKIVQERQTVMDGARPPWANVPESCTLAALLEHINEQDSVIDEEIALRRTANELCAKRYSLQAYDFQAAIHKMSAAVGTEAFMATLERVAGYHQRIVELEAHEQDARNAAREKVDAIARKIYLRATAIEMDRIRELRAVFVAAQDAARALEQQLKDAREQAKNGDLRECRRSLERDEVDLGNRWHIDYPLSIPTHIDAVVAGLRARFERVGLDAPENAGWRSAWVARTYHGMTRKKAFVRRAKSFIWKDTCMDCRQVFSNAEVIAGLLEFDHLPVFNKKATVPSLSGSGVTMAELKNEIRKCDLVCKNCHAMRTWIRHQDPDFVRPSLTTASAPPAAAAPTPPPSPRSGPTTG